MVGPPEIYNIFGKLRSRSKSSRTSIFPDSRLRNTSVITATLKRIQASLESFITFWHTNGMDRVVRLFSHTCQVTKVEWFCSKSYEALAQTTLVHVKMHIQLTFPNQVSNVSTFVSSCPCSFLFPMFTRSSVCSRARFSSSPICFSFPFLLPHQQ